VGGEGWVACWKSRTCNGGVVGRDMLGNLLSLLFALLDTFAALFCPQRLWFYIEVKVLFVLVCQQPLTLIKPNNAKETLRYALCIMH
jgi:hypothetical protein